MQTRPNAALKIDGKIEILEEKISIRKFRQKSMAEAYRSSSSTCQTRISKQKLLIK